jgi:hypothetical protein
LISSPEFKDEQRNQENMCKLELQVVIGWSLAFREEANFNLFCFDEFMKD